MTAFINATTSQGIVVTPDNSGTVAIQGNGVTGLTVNTSGHVLTPARPSFYIKKTTSQSVSNNTLIPFDTVITNVGSCYNPSTNIFTAPIAGFYSFTAKIWINRNGVDWANFFPSINDTTTIQNSGAYYDSAINNSGYANYIVNFQYYLNANDTMSFKIGCGSGTVIVDNSGYFCGFLVG